jgi:cysteine synthase A
VILTAPAKGFDGLLGAFKELIASDPTKYFGANQFFNGDNPAAHYASTGPEIWAQTRGEVDFFVHGVGTGGTIGGAGKFLKERRPGLKIVAIEPSNSRVHVGEKPDGPHSIVGIGAGVKTHFLGADEVPPDEPFVNPALVDEWAHCTGDEAIAYAAKACQEEGMLVGPSAGAALKVACDLAVKDEAAGKTIVVVQPSHGIRYVNHPMWAAVKKEATVALPAPPNMDKECPNVLWRSSDYTPPAE